MFQVVTSNNPSHDQKNAINTISNLINNKNEHSVLLHGITGTGKSATIAWIIEQIQKPTLIIAPNKILASQLYSEFKELFPYSAVEYFVSYYKYYRPESYIPHINQYLRKISSIDTNIDYLRHSTTHSLMNRKDTIVIASVSCLYGLGSPHLYKTSKIELNINDEYSVNDILYQLNVLQYSEESILMRGNYTINNDTINIFPMHDEHSISILLLDKKINKIIRNNKEIDNYTLTTKTHYNMEIDCDLDKIIDNIYNDFSIQYNDFLSIKKIVEAKRLKKQIFYDINLIRKTMSCPGIENYSYYFDGRTNINQRPYCLLDYFADNFLMVIDESHITLPQIRAMYFGDKSRKDNLIKHGFRLESARANRPLKYKEFQSIISNINTIYMSATPGKYESQFPNIKMINRPTGLLDPIIIVKSNKNQFDSIKEEINNTIKDNNKVLIITITKHIAEEVSSFLMLNNIRSRFIHSGVHTRDRVKLINSLKDNEYDVLVGVNLLREGLNLPIVSKIMILDADKQGFLRSTNSLIQIIGRASRNVDGTVIMYCNKISDSMREAIDITNDRRRIQIAYNEKNNIIPKKLSTKRQITILDILDRKEKNNIDNTFTIKALQDEMYKASDEWNFEKAIEIRDKLEKIKGE